MILAVSDIGSGDLGSKRFLKNFLSRKNNYSNTRRMIMHNLIVNYVFYLNFLKMNNVSGTITHIIFGNF